MGNTIRLLRFPFLLFANFYGIVHYCYPKFEQQYWISYYQSIIDSDVLHKDIMCYLDNVRGTSLESIKSVLPMENVIITSDVKMIKDKIHSGYIIIRLHELDETCVLVQAESKQSRAVTLPEVVNEANAANATIMLGVVICFCYMLAHLLRLTSLGRPFLEPIYPTRLRDLKDAFIRLPFSSNPLRPIKLQTENSKRFNAKKAKEKKDVDE